MRKKKRPGVIQIEVDEQDFGTICVCAVRYAMGRMTYMPYLVQSFVKDHLSEICGKSLGVMIDDCDFQRRMNNYGDEKIDKPGWLKYEQMLIEERDRRNKERVDG